jgi:magnesium-transporting ATPase (P-type)
VTLYSKGADSVIAELAAGQTCPAPLAADLDAFAQSGLRTLLVAKRELSAGEVRRSRPPLATAPRCRVED